MVFLAGEWVPAWLGLTLTFLVAVTGVAGLAYWVLRGSARNRAADEAALDREATAEHH
ncbi:MAG TPA: hypothetical protein VFL67_01550 [Mycobacterium sp.]|nr:hypothetical protein [Mycobacterium sp.]